jgi:hypothetical protein
MVFLVRSNCWTGSASVTFRIPTLKERLYGSFTTASSGIAFGRIAKSEVTAGKRAYRRSAPKSSHAYVRLRNEPGVSLPLLGLIAGDTAISRQ